MFLTMGCSVQGEVHFMGIYFERKIGGRSSWDNVLASEVMDGKA